MRRFRNWFAGVGMSVASVFGVHYTVTAPTMQKPAITEIVSSTPAPVINSSGKGIILSQIYGATDDEQALIKDGMKKANTVLFSECFKNKVLDAQFTETNGLTNEQIYDLVINKDVTLGVKVFDGDWMQNYWYKTMGIEAGDSGIIKMNRFFMSDSNEAGSLDIHEGKGHGLGFRHDGTFATSVPYQFNDFFEVCNK